MHDARIILLVICIASTKAFTPNSAVGDRCIRVFQRLPAEGWRPALPIFSTITAGGCRPLKLQTLKDEDFLGVQALTLAAQSAFGFGMLPTTHGSKEPGIPKKNPLPQVFDTPYNVLGWPRLMNTSENVLGRMFPQVVSLGETAARLAESKLENMENEKCINEQAQTVELDTVQKMGLNAEWKCNSAGSNQKSDVDGQHLQYRLGKQDSLDNVALLPSFSFKATTPTAPEPFDSVGGAAVALLAYSFIYQYTRLVMPPGEMEVV
jgi:hypothetical protein